MIKRIKKWKAYKFRLMPTYVQEKLLRQHGGNARFVWNYFLCVNKEEYTKNKKFIFGYDLIALLPKLKKEYNFLSVSFGHSLQAVGRHFGCALRNFFNDESKKGFPVLKKKSFERDSFTIPDRFRIGKNFVFVPKIGEIKLIKHRAIKGKIKYLTIKQDGDQWYCSANVEVKSKISSKIKKDKIIGIDVGLKVLATHSDGEIVNNEKILNNYDRKLKRHQRCLSRRKKNSNNRNKQRNKLSKIHRKVRNTRKDFQHKNTCSTIAKCDGVCVETLNIQGMMRNHKLAKAIADCAWYEFKRQLKYKAILANKIFIEINQFEPTSKTCSCCGWKDIDLTLKDRVFKCEQCNLEIDRDLNAAINIKNIGIRLLSDGQEASARKGTLGETRGCRTSVQCLSKNQEKE